MKKQTILCAMCIIGALYCSATLCFGSDEQVINEQKAMLRQLIPDNAKDREVVDNTEGGDHKSEKAQTQDDKGIDALGRSLHIKTDKEEYTRDESILLTVRLTNVLEKQNMSNNSIENVYENILRGVWYPLKAYDLQVVNSDDVIMDLPPRSSNSKTTVLKKGTKMSFTEYGKVYSSIPVLDGDFTNQLVPPGKSIYEHIPLNRIYDMSLGSSYRITVQRVFRKHNMMVHGGFSREDPKYVNAKYGEVLGTLKSNTISITIKEPE